jgi:hypothetical protein
VTHRVKFDKRLSANMTVRVYLSWTSSHRQFGDLYHD